MSRHRGAAGIAPEEDLCDEKLIRRMRAVSEASVAITSEMAIDKVLQKIVDTARELLNARYAALGVADEERTRLTAFIVSGITPQGERKIGHWPRGLGLLGLLLRDPRPVRVKDISKDARSIGFPAGHPGMTSLLGVPIVSKGRIFGNFYLTDKIGAGEFSQDDEDTLVLFAAHAAVAIENARLYSETSSALQQKIREIQRSERQAHLLAELAGMLPADPLRQQVDLETLSERLAESLGDASGICLVDEKDPKTPRIGLIYHRDEARKRAAEDLICSLWPWLQESVIGPRRSAVISLDGSENSDSISVDLSSMNGHRFRTLVAAPIAAGGRTYGLLVSLASQPLELTQEDLRFASMVADRLAAAIDNRRLYQELFSQKSLLESILDNMSEVLYVADQSGNLLLVNRSFGRFIGATSGEGNVRTVEDLVRILKPRSEDGSPVSFEDLPVNRALQGETFTRQVTQVTPPDETDRYLSLSGSPIRDEQGQTVAALIVGRDITDSKTAEQQKEAYIHAISHDLRNPLTIILAQANYLHRALQKRGLRKTDGQGLEAIEIAAKRMNGMIQDMVDSARLASGRLHLEKEPLDIERFVVSLLDRLAPIIPEDRIVLEFARLPVVQADANRLERILVNLLSNALKYAPPDTPVLLQGEDLPNEVVISVKDRGPGIDPEDLPHLFSSFYRAKGARKVDGLGLGLHICKVLVEAHGGRIWVDSAEGSGSSFFFTLPKSQEPESPESPAE